MFINKYSIFYLLIVILCSSTIYPQPAKKLIIKGLKIFPESELYLQLHLERFEEGKINVSDVVTSIEKFYKDRNYTLVKVFATELRNTGEYTLFVDEGRLGKIIVHNLNSYYSLKFKQQVKIPGRIYNEVILKQNLVKLKQKFPKSQIRMEIEKPPDYESNIIQLDRELRRLKLGEIFDTEIFDRYTPLNDLHFFVTNSNGGDLPDNKNEGFGFDIDYKFPSVFIPQVYYLDKNLFSKKDYLESTLSIGVDPGLKKLLSIHPSLDIAFPPEISYVELTGEYKISPLQNDFIGPLLRGRIFHSKASRSDLGISGYTYLNMRGTLAPEITLLKNLNIYAGTGLEQVFIYDTSTDYNAEQYTIISNNNFWRPFNEARIKFDPVPIRIGNRIDKYLILTYTDYYSGNNSNTLEIKGVYDTEFENLSILSLKLYAAMLFQNPPFYDNISVNNQFFKGFSGDSYYCNKNLSLSGEYRISIYQDYMYAGAFFDCVLFEPEGYILSGTKQGIYYGPTARLLIYDQFELITYFGFDRLFPDNNTGFNLQMKLRKKW